MRIREIRLVVKQWCDPILIRRDSAASSSSLMDFSSLVRLVKDPLRQIKMDFSAV